MSSIKKMFDEKFNIEDMKEEILSKEQPRKFKYYLVPACLVLIITFIFINYNKGLKYHDVNVYVNDIIINYVDVQNESSLSMDIDGKSYDIKIEEIYNVYPNIKNIILPKCLNNVRNIKTYSKNYINENYNVLDGYTMMYNSSDKYIEIFISDTLKQKTRCIEIEDNLKKSLIKNTEVTIISYGDKFIVNFKYDNVFFDIETINFSQDELIMLLKSLIK